MELFLKTTRSVVFLVFVFLVVTPAHAFLDDEAPDSYRMLTDAGEKAAFQSALAATGESSTDRLAVYSQATDNFETSPDGKDDVKNGYTLYAVQDRGRPRGEEYPTYLFRVDDDPGGPELIYKTHAGPRIYHTDSNSDTGCLFSAQKGYSDICLVDVRGNPAPDLPGLRDDFWSDLMKVLGF
ncbi:MAG: hypothetical protein JJ866_24115 [Roseibium sp.]|uniref:hypothetical protein n=1 Tax=Roseibium sp. TaxID=1936156 RepID=UPI001B2A57ED|nr:hypothetical protein [Roseibium sp.]MBO6895044.1 hypothetical protein [Roseibium sp.]MBO6930501.1 hypothetical protein [Roseibium sp.]